MEKRLRGVVRWSQYAQELSFSVMALAALFGLCERPAIADAAASDRHENYH